MGRIRILDQKETEFISMEIGVIGAGQMGAGIAQVCAASGFSVILYDENHQALEKGMGSIRSQLERLVEKGKLPSEKMESTIKNLKRGASLKDFSNVSVCIEAIIENTEIKCDLFKKLDGIVPNNGLLLSNTSSISITKIASATKRPEKVMGMHFMNPVPVMQLVELIKGLQTSDETYSKVEDLTKKLGKVPVLGIDRPGFIVNRILVPMINEAIYLLQEGVEPEAIDTAMKLGTNQPMGPLTLADFVGLDTLLFILQILHRELGEDKYRPAPLLVKYVEAGWYGKKVGRGFYKY